MDADETHATEMEVDCPLTVVCCQHSTVIEGAFGIVLKATHIKSGQDVALKRVFVNEDEMLVSSCSPLAFATYTVVMFFHPPSPSAHTFTCLSSPPVTSSARLGWNATARTGPADTHHSHVRLGSHQNVARTFMFLKSVHQHSHAVIP